MKTKVGSDLDYAIKLLNDEEIVAIPTETVYGLAANGLKETAIRKIFEAKGRPLTNPLILHFPNTEAILPFILELPEELKKITDKFWPGSLTVLLEKSNLVPDIITAGHQRVAVRIPNHSITLDLLSRLNFPLAAPSANPYGKISPTKSEHVLKQLAGKIPYILEGGFCNKGLESTIVGMEGNQVAIYRLGCISIEQIQKIIGYEPKLQITSENSPLTSGMVKHHYAPSTPLLFLDSDFKINNAKKTGFIFFQKDFIGVENKIILSVNGNLEEAAQNLYDALHSMDSEKLDLIYIERFPETELGRTINDRLKRATAKFEK